MRKLIFILPLFATACSGGFEPTSGDYSVTTSVIEDGCGFASDVEDTGIEESEQISSVLISDDGTTVTIDDSTVCDLEGNDFSCIEESELFNASDINESLMAVFSSEISTTGGWTSAGMIEGETSFIVTCEGADCESVGENMGMSTDCMSLWSISLTKVEAE